MNSTTTPPPSGPPSTQDSTAPPPGPEKCSAPAPGPCRPGLRRSVTDRRLGGVAGGVAETFDLDPTLVRAGFVLLTVASAGFALCAYAAAWIFLPARGEAEALASRWYRRHGEGTAGVVAVVALVLIAFIVLRALVTFSSWPNDGDGPGGLVLVGIVALVVARRADRPRSGRQTREETDPSGAESSTAAVEAPDSGHRPEDPTLVFDRPGPERTGPSRRSRRTEVDPEVRHRRRRHAHVRNGGLLGALGAGVFTSLLWATGTWSVGAWIVPAVALVILVAGLAAAPWVGWSWTLSAAAVITLIALAVALVPGVVVRGGLGARYAQPRTPAEVEAKPYRLSAGRQTVDFTALELSAGSSLRTNVDLGMGTVELVVPRTIEVSLRGHLSAGAVRVDGTEVDSAGTDLRLDRIVAATATPVQRPGAASSDRVPPARIIVTIEAGFANVEVTRR